MIEKLKYILQNFKENEPQRLTQQIKNFIADINNLLVETELKELREKVAKYEKTEISKEATDEQRTEHIKELNEFEGDNK